MQLPRGFTLVELLTVIAMLAVLTSLAVPTFRNLQQDAARTREVNQFLQAVHLARGEAMTRNSIVSLCPSADATSCSSPGSPWDQGWIVFANPDGGTPALRISGEPLLAAGPAWTTGRVYANRSTLSFRPFGQSGVTATFTFCDARGTSAARAVIISQTGRPRVTSRNSSGDALECY